jgi:glycosyltransferase involved in cell wall biosynthesis
VTVRVCVNTLAVDAVRGGIRVATEETIRALASSTDVSLRLLVGAHNEVLFREYRDRPGVELRRVGIPAPGVAGRLLADQTTVRRHIGDCDVLWSPNNIGTAAIRRPQVVSFFSHLGIPEVRAETGLAPDSRLKRVLYGPLARASLRRAAAVVVTSTYVADRLAEYHDLESGKVRVVGCGVDAELAERVPTGAADPPYALVVGTLFPYKNVRAAIEAISELSDAGHRLELVVAGRDPDGRQIGILRELAARLGVADAVRFAGRVDDDELAALYAAATALIFPSLAEGFGIPAIEAMAYGVPVIAADRASLHEVVGDAGLLVDPAAPGAIAAALDRVITTSEVRGDLVRRGRLAVRDRTWSAVAHEYAELFDEVAGR